MKFPLESSIHHSQLISKFADLQCDSSVKKKFSGTFSLIDFCSKYVTRDKCPGIYKDALFMFSTFVSTDIYGSSCSVKGET